MKLYRREESGYALIVTMMVVLIVGGLVLSVIGTAERGLRASRRSGDSANALQVADAGLNAAVKRIADYTGPVPLVIEETLGTTGDKFRVVATKESAGVWHIDSIGTDSNGLRRRVKASAVALSKFANAVFAQSAINFGSGVAVDSYKSGAGSSTEAQFRAATCNRKGAAGTNNPAVNDLNVQGGGGGVRNCTEQMPLFSDNPKGYVYDSCIGYGDSEPVAKFLNESANATKRTCGTINYATPSYPFDAVVLPGVASGGALDCSGPITLAPGKYVYSSVTLKNGCSIRSTDASWSQNSPIEIYTAGAVNIGTGSGHVINAPPAPPNNCAGTSATGGDYYTGTAQNPLHYYCTGWPGRVQIYAAGSGTVNFAQHAKFFGVVWAPGRSLEGGPHSTIWGAIAGSSVKSGAQITVHYDEALADLHNGYFQIKNWREEPLS